MANTYTQIYVQLVFAVKGRKNLIAEQNREEVEKYICGIVSKNESKPIAIFCNPDHIHLLIGLNPSVAISDIARDIKASSSKWINAQKWNKHYFNWQSGFGAFTYANSQIDAVVKYILNQPIHHKKITFKSEYMEFLEKFDVEYNPKYLFDDYH